MKNPISIGSIVQGIHRIPTLLASTKAKHGNPRKSIWKKAASWFSITLDMRTLTTIDPAALNPQQGGGVVP
jgi:hypothetical protein